MSDNFKFSPSHQQLKCTVSSWVLLEFLLLSAFPGIWFTSVIWDIEFGNKFLDLGKFNSGKLMEETGFTQGRALNNCYLCRTLCIVLGLSLHAPARIFLVHGEKAVFSEDGQCLLLPLSHITHSLTCTAH